MRSSHNFLSWHFTTQRSVLAFQTWAFQHVLSVPEHFKKYKIKLVPTLIPTVNRFQKTQLFLRILSWKIYWKPNNSSFIFVDEQIYLKKLRNLSINKTDSRAMIRF